MGSVGQGAYSAAKAGIAALTLGRGGGDGALRRDRQRDRAVGAHTHDRSRCSPTAWRAPEQGFDANDPANISPLVVWLGSADSRDVTGRVFEVEGGMISVADGWQHGPAVDRGHAGRRPRSAMRCASCSRGRQPAAPVYGAQ